MNTWIVVSKKEKSLSKQANTTKRKYAGRGRKIEFDPDQVMRDAMMVFWRKGFDATSYEDLVSETGVQRYGLYKVLGDKDQAFAKVMEHYVHQVIKEFTAPMRSDQAGLSEVYAYFDALKHFNEEQAIGCMVCNTIAANRQRSDAIFNLSEKMLLMVRDSLQHALEGAVRKGELRPESHTGTLAQTLLGTMVGASTLFRSALGPEAGTTFIEQNLKLVLGCREDDRGNKEN